MWWCERCAGLDVHRDNVVATVRVPGTGRRRVEQQTQTFSATLAGLAALGAWLAQFGVTLVGMEATGVYWKTVFQALEDRFECWLLNAHHLRNVPGRKTDVKDSEWICQLVQHGLVRPSFVPPPEIRRLRDLTRLRKAQINERARSIQRLEKVLQDAGIKLSSVASTTYSKSARAMLEALLGRNQRSRSARRAGQGPDAPEDPAAARGARQPLPDRAPRRDGRATARAHRRARRRDRQPQRPDRRRPAPRTRT